MIPRPPSPTLFTYTRLFLSIHNTVAVSLGTSSAGSTNTFSFTNSEILTVHDRATAKTDSLNTYAAGNGEIDVKSNPSATTLNTHAGDTDSDKTYNNPKHLYN